MLGSCDYSVMKRKKNSLQFKIICFINIIFWGIMIFLTFEARNIHEGQLPHVKQQRFEVILEDVLYNNNQVFVVKTGEKNGEDRAFAELREVVLGEETEEGYKVISGINIWDNVIVWSDGELSDGVEVIVEK